MFNYKTVTAQQARIDRLCAERMVLTDGLASRRKMQLDAEEKLKAAQELISRFTVWTSFSVTFICILIGMLSAAVVS